MYSSRKARVESRRNIRNAIILLILTLAIGTAFIRFGIPALVKVSVFLTDLKSSGEAVDIDDKTPPAPPKLNDLPEFTNNLKVDIEGSAEPGASVILNINGVSEELIVNKEGGFIHSFTLRGGENSVSAIAKDNSGNESQITKVYKIVYDDNPPDLQVTSPDNNSEYYGSKQRQIVIEGETEKDANVTINDRFVSVDDDGSFAFATTLSEGDNEFTIVTTDKAENESQTVIVLKYSQ